MALDNFNNSNLCNTWTGPYILYYLETYSPRTKVVD